MEHKEVEIVDKEVVMSEEEFNDKIEFIETEHGWCFQAKNKALPLNKSSFSKFVDHCQKKK
jgi:hypothetical protein